MNPSNITQDLVGLEKKFWKAMTDHDLETALSLTDFPCLIAGSHGVSSVTREQFIEMFNGHGDQMRDFEFSAQPQVRLLGPDTAVIAYQVKSTLVVDGQPRTLQAADASTWIKRDGQWLCAMHTETELQH